MQKVHDILIGLLCQHVDVLVLNERLVSSFHQEPGALYVA